MHQQLCRNCSDSAVPGCQYCVNCEPLVKRQLQRDRDRLHEQLEIEELEAMLTGYRNQEEKREF